MDQCSMQGTDVAGQSIDMLCLYSPSVNLTSCGDAYARDNLYHVTGKIYFDEATNGDLLRHICSYGNVWPVPF